MHSGHGDRCGYDDQQKDAIYDVRGPCQMHIQASRDRLLYSCACARNNKNLFSGLQSAGCLYCEPQFFFCFFPTDVRISFTESRYRANEPNPGGPATALPVIVAKNLRIASRVELVVVPLTIQEAMATSLPLPPNVPEDNFYSPPYAGIK